MNPTPIILLLLLAAFASCTGDLIEREAAVPEVAAPAEGQTVAALPAMKWPPLPRYTVHRRNPYWKGGEQGHIIVPKGKELSRDSLVQLLKTITEKERFTLCRFYINTDAYQANVSALFNSAHPGVGEGGYLGAVEEGEYTNVYE